MHQLNPRLLVIQLRNTPVICTPKVAKPKTAHADLSSPKAALLNDLDKEERENAGVLKMLDRGEV